MITDKFFEFMPYLDGLKLDDFFGKVKTLFVLPIANTIAVICGTIMIMVGIVQIAKHFMKRGPVPPMALIMTLFVFWVGGVMFNNGANGVFEKDDVTGITGWSNAVKKTIVDMANNGGSGDVAQQTAGNWSGPGSGRYGLTSGNGNGANYADRNFGLTSGNGNGANYADRNFGLTSNNTNHFETVQDAKDYVHSVVENNVKSSVYQGLYDTAYAQEFGSLENQTGLVYELYQGKYDELTAKINADKQKAYETKLAELKKQALGDSYNDVYVGLYNDPTTGYQATYDNVYNNTMSSILGKSVDDMINDEIASLTNQMKTDTYNNKLDAYNNPKTGANTLSVDYKAYRDANKDSACASMITSNTVTQTDENGNVTTSTVYIVNGQEYKSAAQARNAAATAYDEETSSVLSNANALAATKTDLANYAAQTAVDNSTWSIASKAKTNVNSSEEVKNAVSEAKAAASAAANARLAEIDASASAQLDDETITKLETEAKTYADNQYKTAENNAKTAATNYANSAAAAQARATATNTAKVQAAKAASEEADRIASTVESTDKASINTILNNWRNGLI